MKVQILLWRYEEADPDPDPFFPLWFLIQIPQQLKATEKNI